MSRKAHPPTHPSVQAIGPLLAPSARPLLDAAVAEATAGGLDLWLVGGAVRDLALGRAIHDLDLALAVDPGRFASAVAMRLPPPAAEVDREPRFGTAGVRRAGARLDLARLRTETYEAPGALPQVRFVDNVERDLARRDFSVNAMALGLAGPHAGALVDPFDGFADLRARRLRVLHDRSFIDDATRLWRGARTAALFALRPTPETATLIAAGTRWLQPISGERLLAELRFTAARGRAGRTLALAEAWGVLRGTHPALRFDPRATAALRHRSGPLPIGVLLAVLIAPLDPRGAIVRRLAVPRALAATVEQAAQLLDASGHRDGAIDPAILQRLAASGAEARLAARWLDPVAQPALQRDLGRWERTRPPLDAAALIALGVSRGPALGAMLDRLRRARYLGTLGTGAEARREVTRLLVTGDEGRGR